MPVLGGHQSYQAEGMAGALLLFASLALGAFLLSNTAGPARRAAVIFATTALVTLTVGWMRSTWDDWYHHRCVEHNAEWCRTSKEPTFPFTLP